MNISRILVLMVVLLVTTIFGFAPVFKVVHAAPVIFTQSTCVYCPTDSVAVSGSTQQWKLGVKNNNAFTIYVQFSVSGVGSSGHSFALVSNCVAVGAKPPPPPVPPNPSNNNILTLPLTSAEIGETFSASSALEWDTTACNSLSNILTGPTFAFNVVP